MIFIYVLVFVLYVLIFVYLFNLSELCNKFFRDLYILHHDYISRTEYEYLLNKYRPLRKRCALLHFGKIKKFMCFYDDLLKNIKELNKEYVKEELVKNKEYFDNLFEYPLDDEQRKAIITDEDNNLIIAGAGSGKTTTIIGKARYLIDKKCVDPKEIIAITFTNATKDSFIEKLEDNSVECTTFHKLGLNVLTADMYKPDICDDFYLNKCIKEYLTKEIYKFPDKCTSLINFMAYYFHVPPEADKKFGEIIEYENGLDFETLKHKYQNAVGDKLISIKEEKVKSVQELIIANFLFLNGIEYEYEPKYKYDVADKIHKQYHPDFYLKDYDIYLEHFGINEDGKTPQYSEIEERKYLDGIEFKRRTHAFYKTNLLETYSYEFYNTDIVKMLTHKMKTVGVELKPISYKELFETLSLLDNKDAEAFIRLISKFINMFKGNNYDSSKLDGFYSDAIKNKNIRNTYLLDIIKDVYLYYELCLHKDNYLDFNDMINKATEFVNSGFNKKISYIIIDEFQDISYSRYCLVKAIQDKTHAKVIAVGDDWQSIYRFSGCDLDLFVKFKEYFKYPSIMYISNTYRNSQDLIDLSGKFIMQNEKGQIKKSLKSNKELVCPIQYYYYDKNIVLATKAAISDLRKIGCKKIAILGRNNSDLNKYKGSDLFDDDIIFSTVHKSKGLEYDGVIICNMSNHIAGFPNKMLDDPVLNYVTITKDDFMYEEERRLFYVALTRTKTKCMLLVPLRNPSVFVQELYELSGETIPKTVVEDDERLHNPSCPKCKTGVLQTMINRNDNSEFVGCSNYPKCDFTYNYLNILTDKIKCPSCGGYLVKRHGSYGIFYGCTNYPFCNRTIDDRDKSIEKELVTNKIKANDYQYSNNTDLEEKIFDDNVYKESEVFNNDTYEVKETTEEDTYSDVNKFSDNIHRKYEYAYEVGTYLDDEKFNSSKYSRSKKDMRNRFFVDVKFDSSSTIYSYLCKEDFNYKVNDRIKIKGNDGLTEVTLVKEPYYSSKNEFDYKYLPIATEQEIEEDNKLKQYVDIRFGKNPNVRTYLCPDNYYFRKGQRISIDYKGERRLVTIVRAPYKDNLKDRKYVYIKLYK